MHLVATVQDTKQEASKCHQNGLDIMYRLQLYIFSSHILNIKVVSIID